MLATIEAQHSFGSIDASKDIEGSLPIDQQVKNFINELRKENSAGSAVNKITVVIQDYYIAD